MQRVVITGLGAVSPLGNDVASTWRALIEGRSGVGYLTCFDTTGLNSPIAGEARSFRPEDYFGAKEVRRMDRSTQFGVVAAMEALRDAGLEARQPMGAGTGVAFGSSLGGYHIVAAQAEILATYGPQKISPFMLPSILPDATAVQISIRTGAMGPTMAVLAASASGGCAVGEAAEIIRRGDADVMIAGACEAPLTPLLYSAFAAMRGLAPAGDNPETACKPFDSERGGFVISEGSGALVLESLEHAQARGKEAYAEVAGFGSANDAFHMIAEEPTARGLILAIRMALRKSGLDVADIGYVNAHGTASRMNDPIETRALKEVFGQHAYSLAVSSTKSMTGHLMGAAGALEAVISTLALREGLLPPTINYASPDPECDLDYVPGVARAAPGLKAVLTNSVGLGGHNVALVLSKVES